MLSDVKKIVVYYHKADLDGVCSAAIINMFPKIVPVKFIGVDYPMVLDYADIDGDTAVIIVDFSFAPDDMLEVHKIAKKMIWCDHHASAIRNSVERGYSDMLGSRNPNFAGCELTWSFFYPSTKMPMAVKMLGRYDVWDKSDPMYDYFQYGMRAAVPDLSYTSHVWNDLLAFEAPNLFFEVLRSGEDLFKYQEEQNALVARGICFEFDFHGYRVLAANRSHINSQFFDTLFDPQKHDLMMRMSFDGTVAKLSMYTTKDLDLSVLAQKYGGGGHAKACGFSMGIDGFADFIKTLDCRRVDGHC